MIFTVTEFLKSQDASPPKLSNLLKISERPLSATQQWMNETAASHSFLYYLANGFMLCSIEEKTNRPNASMLLSLTPPFNEPNAYIILKHSI